MHSTAGMPEKNGTLSLGCRDPNSALAESFCSSPGDWPPAASAYVISSPPVVTDRLILGMCNS